MVAFFIQGLTDSHYLQMDLGSGTITTVATLNLQQKIWQVLCLTQRSLKSIYKMSYPYLVWQVHSKGKQWKQAK